MLLTPGDEGFYPPPSSCPFLYAVGEAPISRVKVWTKCERSLKPTAYNRASLIQDWLPTLNFANGITAIKSLTPSPSPNGEGSIYTISGQRLAQAPARGIYIENGIKRIAQ